MTRVALCLVAALVVVSGRGIARAESTPAATCACPATAESASSAAPLDLNRASEADLLELPGIGPAKAKAILAFREQHGGFSSVSQLMRIKGLGRATLRRLRPLLTVSTPPTAAPTARALVAPNADRVR